MTQPDGFQLSADLAELRPKIEVDLRHLVSRWSGNANFRRNQRIIRQIRVRVMDEALGLIFLYEVENFLSGKVGDELGACLADG